MLGINALFRTEYQILILYNFFQTPGLILSSDKTHQSSVALSPLWSGPLEQFPPPTTSSPRSLLSNTLNFMTTIFQILIRAV